MSMLTLNDLEIYYEVVGQGEPLLLIAGLASDSQSWLPIVEELKTKFTLIMPDNRGVGRTTPQNVDISIEKMSNDCMKLIKHLGYSKVNVLGHSMGGLIAQDLAIRYSEMVSKLILIGTSSVNSKRNNYLLHDLVSLFDKSVENEIWFRNLFYWIFTRQFFENKEMVEMAIEDSINYPYPQSRDALAKQVIAIEKFNCTEKLSSIQSSTLIINGSDDLLFSPVESRQKLQAIPNAEFCVIYDAAHSTHVEKPSEFTEKIISFLIEL